MTFHIAVFQYEFFLIFEGFSKTKVSELVLYCELLLSEKSHYTLFFHFWRQKKNEII